MTNIFCDVRIKLFVAKIYITSGGVAVLRFLDAGSQTGRRQVYEACNSEFAFGGDRTDFFIEVVWVATNVN